MEPEKKKVRILTKRELLDRKLIPLPEEEESVWPPSVSYWIKATQYVREVLRDIPHRSSARVAASLRDKGLLSNTRKPTADQVIAEYKSLGGMPIGGAVEAPLAPEAAGGSIEDTLRAARAGGIEKKPFVGEKLEKAEHLVPAQSVNRDPETKIPASVYYDTKRDIWTNKYGKEMEWKEAVSSKGKVFYRWVLKK